VRFSPSPRGHARATAGELRDERRVGEQALHFALLRAEACFVRDDLGAPAGDLAEELREVADRDLLPVPRFTSRPIAASHSASARNPAHVSATKLKSRVGVTAQSFSRSAPSRSCVTMVGITARADWRGP